MPTEIEHPYIAREPSVLAGEPIIMSTRTPVRAIVELWRMGIGPEEIPFRLPHLSLAQVFDALSYYSDHRSEIDRHIERNEIADNKLHPIVKRQ